PTRSSCCRNSRLANDQMETISVVLSMLAAVVVSGIIVRALPLAVPTPLVQIALGAVIAAFSPYEVSLNPDLFFLLFLPPLLFLDGWRIPKEGLLRDKGMILELSLGLVFFTVLGIGAFIHWMIPAMPGPSRWRLRRSFRRRIRSPYLRSRLACRCRKGSCTCSRASRC